MSRYRYHVIDTKAGGTVIHESNRLPWLQPLRQKPAYKPPKRRRPRNDPLTHLAFFAVLLAVVASLWLGNHVDVSFNW